MKSLFHIVIWNCNVNSIHEKFRFLLPFRYTDPAVDKELGLPFLLLKTLLNIETSDPEFVIYRNKLGFALLATARLITLNITELKTLSKLSATRDLDVEVISSICSKEAILKALQHIKFHLEIVKSKLDQTNLTEILFDTAIESNISDDSSIPRQVDREEEKLFWDYLSPFS